MELVAAEARDPADVGLALAAYHCRRSDDAQRSEDEAMELVAAAARDAADVGLALAVYRRR